MWEQLERFIGIRIDDGLIILLIFFFGLGFLYGKLTVRINTIKMIAAFFLGVYFYEFLSDTHWLIRTSFLLGIVANHHEKLKHISWGVRDRIDTIRFAREARKHDDLRAKEEELRQREADLRERERQQHNSGNYNQQSGNNSQSRNQKKEKSKHHTSYEDEIRWGRGYRSKPEKDASEPPPKGDRKRKEKAGNSSSRQKAKPKSEAPPKSKDPKDLNPNILTDAYEILGVRYGASMEECKKARLALLHMHHPDKVAHLNETRRKMAEEEAKRINMAWDRVKKSL